MIDNGILGIREAIVKGNFSEEAWTYIQKLFPEAKQNGSRLTYDMRTTCLAFEPCHDLGLSVALNATTTNLEYSKQSFRIENVIVST